MWSEVYQIPGPPTPPDPPSVEITVDRLITTPNDRLRVNYEFFELAGVPTVTMALLDSGDNKLEFTAYDERSANTVRSIYTTKAVAAAAVTNAASDFTTSGFFSRLTGVFSIPVDDSLEASDELDLTGLVNPATVWKAGSEQVVYIDLPSIAGISSGTNVLTVQLFGDDGASNVVGEIDVTIIPDGSVTFTKISSVVTDAAAFAATQNIVIGSEDGASGNRFTGNEDHEMFSVSYLTAQGTRNSDRAFGMCFDTDEYGLTLTDINFVMSNAGGVDTSPKGATNSWLKLELWKVNVPLSELDLTGNIFPDPKEIIFTGTGQLSTEGIAMEDVFQIDLPADIVLDATNRYGWVLRWNTTDPAAIHFRVDNNGPANPGSFPGGNHLRQDGWSGTAFPFIGKNDNYDIVFFLNGLIPTPYGIWAEAEGLTGANNGRAADPDGDGNKNLVEYALGSDPEVADASDFQILGTAVEGGTNFFEYVYNRRRNAGARGLTYTLTDTANLPIGNWVTNTTAEVDAGIIDADFETVTNRWSTDDNPIQFIDLIIQED